MPFIFAINRLLTYIHNKKMSGKEGFFLGVCLFRRFFLPAVYMVFHTSFLVFKYRYIFQLNDY